MNPERRRGWTDVLGLFVTSLALPCTVMCRRFGGRTGVVPWVFRREIHHWSARPERLLLTLDCVLWIQAGWVVLPPSTWLRARRVSVFKTYGPLGKDFFKTFPPLS